MVTGRIDRQSDDFHISAVELRLDPCHIAEFGRADRSEVLRVREQDGPGVADPIMKAHPPISGFRLEIRCCIANFHLFFLLHFTAEKIFPNSEAKSQYPHADAAIFQEGVGRRTEAPKNCLRRDQLAELVEIDVAT